MFFMSGMSRLVLAGLGACVLGLVMSVGALRFYPHPAGSDVSGGAVEILFLALFFSESSSACSDSEFSFTWGYASDSVAEAEIPSLGLSQILRRLNVEFIRRLFVSPRPAQWTNSSLILSGSSK